MISQNQWEKEIMTPELARWLSLSGVPERLEEIRNNLIDNQKWLLSLPLYIETEDFILLHGGMHPEMGISAPPGIITMLRMYEGRPWYEYYE